MNERQCIQPHESAFVRRIYYLNGIYPTNVTLFSPRYRTKTGAVRYRKP